MIKVFLAAGVAALAISVPAVADPGKKEGGKGRDRGAEVQKERGGGGKVKAQENRKNFAEQRQKAEERSFKRARDIRKDVVERNKKFDEKRFEARKRVAERVGKAQEKAFERRAKVEEKFLERIADSPNRRLARMAERRVVRLNEWDDHARGGVWVDGCPPGLAKKPVSCVPPGQVKNVVGGPLSALSNRIALQPLPSRLQSLFADDDDYYYRFGNGYVYRVDRDDQLITALLPLFGLGLTTGQLFPTALSNYYLPTALTPFYPTFSSDDYYRYANGYVYEIDGQTGLIEDVDPMLGFGYGFGQMMPLTYSAYNVPYQYRPLYYDTSDYYYRYAPGAIYQVDPTTSLITAVAALLTGGMTVGQQMPLGYSAYNVPYQYRATYFDTPNDWYRYSNGYVYRVDPTTQLVTAIVASILT